VAVVHFALWGDADVVVRLTEQFRVGSAHIAGVSEDEGDLRLIEEVEAVEDVGEVGAAVDAAVGVGG
jgi:hypothetical protein